jgi:hypothetical protein
VGTAGALVIQEFREWLRSRTRESLADYRSASRMLAKLRRQPGHQNLLIRGELALDPDTGTFYLKARNRWSELLLAFVELGNQLQRNGEPYLKLVRPCKNAGCRRQRWFFAQRPNQIHCSDECRSAYGRCTPEGREKRKVYMRGYRKENREREQRQDQLNRRKI